MWVSKLKPKTDSISQESQTKETQKPSIQNFTVKNLSQTIKIKIYGSKFLEINHLNKRRKLTK